MNNVNSPYNTYSTDAAPKLSMDISDQFKAHQREEEQNKSPKILPHVAENSLTETVGSMYEKLLQIKNILNKIEKEPKRNKESIKKAQGITDEIGKSIMALYEPVDKLYL
jgi:hypothetical protein